MKSVAMAAAATLLMGCSAVIEGTSQEIVVNTTPPAANCGLYRQGLKIGEVAGTPGTATIKKTKYDIRIVCSKPGYQETTYFNRSGTAGATLGNIVTTAGIGWAVDSASGADNKYDSPVNMTLPPIPVLQPVPLRVGRAPAGPAALP